MNNLRSDEIIQAVSSRDEELDLGQIFAALKRRWPWIAVSGAISLIISGVQLLQTKPVYQAQFQIVLASEQSGGLNSLFNQNSALAAVTGLGLSGRSDSIATEIQILTSPSVLLPIFEAVKSHKTPPEAKSMRFQAWAQSAITAEEQPGTSVLNVEFRNTDKELVLPITQMISNAYQKYSNRGRDRELSNVISYLNEQIAKIKPKSIQSSRLALDYGYSNGLGLLDGLPLAGSITGASGGENAGTKITGGGGSIEKARTASMQRVRALKVQIEATKRAGTGSIYFASQLGSLNNKSSTFDQLTSVETRLAGLRSRFKDNDPLVKKLELERKTLVYYINEQTLALLRGELELAQAKLLALNRPKEVISRHRELTQEALRDEATLVSLQNRLKQVELEKARASSPWELISTPTQLDYPVSPNKKRILGLGLLVGLSIGGVLALIVDRRSDLIFSIDSLSRNLPGPLLERLPSRNKISQEAWFSSIQLLADGPLSNKKSVALIPVGSLDSSSLSTLKTCLRNSLPDDCELLVSSSLLETRHCCTQILVTSPGAAKREQLIQLREQLSLQSTPIAGWILLDCSLRV